MRTYTVTTKVKTADDIKYDEVSVEAENVGVSNGVLYLMSGTGNKAVFAREEWTKAIRND